MNYDFCSKIILETVNTFLSTNLPGVSGIKATNVFLVFLFILNRFTELHQKNFQEVRKPLNLLALVKLLTKQKQNVEFLLICLTQPDVRN